MRKRTPGAWLSARNGALCLDAEPEGCSDEETEEADLSGITANLLGRRHGGSAGRVCGRAHGFDVWMQTSISS